MKIICHFPTGGWSYIHSLYPTACTIFQLQRHSNDAMATNHHQVTAPCTAVIAEARSFSSSWWLSWLELWWGISSDEIKWNSHSTAWWPGVLAAEQKKIHSQRLDVIGLRKSHVDHGCTRVELSRPSGWAAAWRCCHTPRSTCSRWSWDSQGNTPVSHAFFGRSWMNLQDVSQRNSKEQRTNCS